jgi:ATP-binding protein involved in chromosome partitioning
MIDPRLAVVDGRLAGVRRILPVTGGKGGIGKSLFASLLALDLVRRGHTVGLLDLDFTGPCDHLILGIPGGFPSEEFGVEPPLHHGIHFMSISIFAGDSPTPLRGTDLSSALLELLAITRWGELDHLVIDMPPGLGDMTLDAVRLIERAEYVAVATASSVVVETVRRNLTLLQELKRDVLGVVENMQHAETAAVHDLAEVFRIPYLGAVPFDAAIEPALGDAKRLAQTVAARSVQRIVDQLGSIC